MSHCWNEGMSACKSLKIWRRRQTQSFPSQPLVVVLGSTTYTRNKEWYSNKDRSFCLVTAWPSGVRCCSSYASQLLTPLNSLSRQTWTGGELFIVILARLTMWVPGYMGYTRENISTHLLECRLLWSLVDHKKRKEYFVKWIYLSIC